MIIYTCPKCGSDLHNVMIATYPPIDSKKCLNCGWEYVYERGDSDDVIRVPFTEPEEYKRTGKDAGADCAADPCAGCSDDPRNGGSGVCSCTIPYMAKNSPYRIT